MDLSADEAGERLIGIGGAFLGNLLGGIALDQMSGVRAAVKEWRHGTAVFHPRSAAI